MKTGIWKNGAIMSQEVAEVNESTEIGPYRGQSWDVLDAEAFEAEGSDQVKADLLTGFPFIAVHGTLREGDYLHAGCGKNHPYLYLTIVVGPEREIDRAVKRGRIKEENREDIDPGEVLGFVEAGTGLYRQILGFLEAQAYVVLPEGLANGPFGESRFDSLPADWDFLKGEVRFDSEGQPVWDFDFRLKFPRGLRISEYENEYTKQGKTRYAG
jgi:hypothetical protein